MRKYSIKIDGKELSDNLKSFGIDTVKLSKAFNRNDTYIDHACETNRIYHQFIDIFEAIGIPVTYYEKDGTKVSKTPPEKIKESYLQIKRSTTFSRRNELFTPREKSVYDLMIQQLDEDEISIVLNIHKQSVHCVIQTINWLLLKKDDPLFTLLDYDRSIYGCLTGEHADGRNFKGSYIKNIDEFLSVMKRNPLDLLNYKGLGQKKYEKILYLVNQSKYKEDIS